MTDIILAFIAFVVTLGLLFLKSSELICDYIPCPECAQMTDRDKKKCRFCGAIINNVA
jgi:hypothetical protein